MAKRCRALVPADGDFCGKHWSYVPEAVKARVWEAQELLKAHRQPTTDELRYRIALDAAIDAIAHFERRGQKTLPVIF